MEEEKSLERVDALWFPDGNIIIRADNVLFRVFKGILAAHSPVFADLLAFPQPEDAESIEGCAVLQLDDSAADTMYFLKALFDYEFFAPYPAKTDFDAIHGVLRLGTKYRVEPLRRRALEHLASAHPPTLAGWDALCSTRLTFLGSPTLSTPTSPSSSVLTPTLTRSRPQRFAAGPSFDFEHLELPIITLARYAAADWILPTAFYRAIAALTSAEILDGIDYTGVHVEMERSDKLLCLDAEKVLLGDATSDILGFLWSPGVIPTCERTGVPVGGTPQGSNASAASSTTSLSSASATVTTTGAGGIGNSPGFAGMNPCTAARLAMRVTAERWRGDRLWPVAVAAKCPSASKASVSVDGEAAEDGGDENMRDREGEADGEEEGDARAIWGEEDFARLAPSVCAPCLAYMKTDWAERRARFWERLPAVFGLAGWEELGVMENVGRGR
ncbi:hypothetical protein FB45DRAFT_336265 [Roridomyces roridus]|uniref:BTB domain-containing protein n=1 Tax=Roridomyces roridus TaxID=1738132 RepID=A0AAD7B544_9AGAR|nr:hypothetical protein FB45DRAFT_336265 [Roridomyces roridus]